VVAFERTEGRTNGHDNTLIIAFPNFVNGCKKRTNSFSGPDIQRTTLNDIRASAHRRVFASVVKQLQQPIIAWL
jgi:hypothetical protein